MDETRDVYEIRTILDFTKVPANKLNSCLEDFCLWIIMAGRRAEYEKSTCQAFGVPDGTIQVNTGLFRWVDDGVTGVSAVSIHDAGGKEILRFKVEDSQDGCNSNGGTDCPAKS